MDITVEEEIKNVKALRFVEYDLAINPVTGFQNRLHNAILSNCDFRLDSTEEVQFIFAEKSPQLLIVAYYNSDKETTHVHVDENRVLSKENPHLRLPTKYESFAFSATHKIFAAYSPEELKVSPTVCKETLLFFFFLPQISFWHLSDGKTFLSYTTCDIKRYVYASDCSKLELVFFNYRKCLLFVDTKNVVRFFDLKSNQVIRNAEFKINPHCKILITPDDGFLASITNSGATSCATGNSENSDDDEKEVC